MKILLPKTLAEPLTIPWVEIAFDAEREIDKLLVALMDEIEIQEMNTLEMNKMNEMMHKLAERIQQNDMFKNK